MSEPRITIEIDGAVATILVNRPDKLNAFDIDMLKDLSAACDTVEANAAIRVTILTGAGKAFSAGGDIRAWGGMRPEEFGHAWVRFGHRVFERLATLRMPLVAALNGHALGGGLETALSCDIRIASANAKFAAPEIKLGWIGGGGMAALLTNAVGSSHAALMVMTGDPIDAARALAWGLVSEVVEPDGLMARARALAATIASRAPIAAETAKANLYAAATMPLDQAMRYERDLQAICFATDDAREGRAAFAEKRVPVFNRR